MIIIGSEDFSDIFGYPQISSDICGHLKMSAAYGQNIY